MDEVAAAVDRPYIPEVDGPREATLSLRDEMREMRRRIDALEKANADLSARFNSLNQQMLAMCRVIGE